MACRSRLPSGDLQRELLFHTSSTVSRHEPHSSGRISYVSAAAHSGHHPAGGTYRHRINATMSLFSSADNFVLSTILKNSTVSSRVSNRPSCRYGGESLIPRRGNVLIGPCVVATRPLIVWVL